MDIGPCYTVVVRKTARAIVGAVVIMDIGPRHSVVVVMIPRSSVVVRKSLASAGFAVFVGGFAVGAARQSTHRCACAVHGWDFETNAAVNVVVASSTIAVAVGSLTLVENAAVGAPAFCPCGRGLAVGLAAFGEGGVGLAGWVGGGGGEYEREEDR